MMSGELPTAKSSWPPDERARLKRIVERRGLCGLANDTKWDELINAMRLREGWRPKFRCRCVDAPAYRAWDGEWFYHLPFPLVSLEWLDLEILEETRELRLPPRVHVTDHSGWIEELLNRVGLEYVKGQKMIRIFGYSPKDMEFFDVGEMEDE
jgi:hypothetical protein